MISERLKQRLVGALVLVALAVIFVPSVFNLQPPQPVDQSTQIPPAPEIEPVVVGQQGPREAVDEPLAHGELFDLEEPLPASGESAPDQDLEPRADKPPAKVPAPATAPPSAPPKLTAEGLPQAWLIQVASYREADTAARLAQRLQDAGFKAFVRQGQANGASVHRVQVGPHVLRKNADEEKRRIDSSLGVKSLVLPFEP